MIFLCAIWNSIFYPVLRVIPIVLLNILKCFQVWKIFKGIDRESNIDVIRVLILVLIGIFAILVLEIFYPFVINFIIGILTIWEFRIFWKDSNTHNIKIETILIFTFPSVFVISSTILNFISNEDHLTIMIGSLCISALVFMIMILLIIMKEAFVEFISFFKKQYQICQNKRKD